MHSDTPTPTGANYRRYFAQLCNELPLLPDEDAETLAERQRSAMDAVEALNPDNATEAVRVISTSAHAGAALREAALAGSAGDAEKLRQCRAQASSMARASDATLRSLLRIQAHREKQEVAMHPAFMGRAGYWFKEVSVPAPPPAAEAEPEPVRDFEAEADMYAIMYPTAPPASARPGACRPGSTSGRRNRSWFRPSCTAPAPGCGDCRSRKLQRRLSK